MSIVHLLVYVVGESTEAEAQHNETLCFLVESIRLNQSGALHDLLEFLELLLSLNLLRFEKVILEIELILQQL